MKSKLLTSVRKGLFFTLCLSFLSACGAAGNGMLPPASLLEQDGPGSLVQSQGRPGAQAQRPGARQGGPGGQMAGPDERRGPGGAPRLPHELIEAVLAEPELAEGFEALKGLPPQEHHAGLVELLADHPELLELVPDPAQAGKAGGRPPIGMGHRIQHMGPGKDCPEGEAKQGPEHEDGGEIGGDNGGDNGGEPDSPPAPAY